MTLPSRLRNAIGVAEGDLVEASVQRGKIVLTPKTVMDRIPPSKAAQQRVFKQLRADAPEWLKAIWAASKRRGTDKLTMRQIDAVIAEARQEQPQKKTKQLAK
jgi:bifunctional DNA-binding transcriptional regulator/antitoxin component of YhaV-PrlF toxin-antitoxin module